MYQTINNTRTAQHNTTHSTTHAQHITTQHIHYTQHNTTHTTQHNTTQHTAQETNTACHSAEEVLMNVRICGTGSARSVCRILEWTSRSCGDSRRKSRPRSCPVRQGGGKGRGEGGEERGGQRWDDRRGRMEEGGKQLKEVYNTS